MRWLTRALFRGTVIGALQYIAQHNTSNQKHAYPSPRLLPVSVLPFNTLTPTVLQVARYSFISIGAKSLGLFLRGQAGIYSRRSRYIYHRDLHTIQTCFDKERKSFHPQAHPNDQPCTRMSLEPNPNPKPDTEIDPNPILNPNLIQTPTTDD